MKAKNVFRESEIHHKINPNLSTTVINSTASGILNP